MIKPLGHITIPGLGEYPVKTPDHLSFSVSFRSPVLFVSCDWFGVDPELTRKVPHYQLYLIVELT